jgi:rhodanese-related sulfurtransferase
MASHDAAREAAKLGYRKVFVMPDGIHGWMAAGKPVRAGAE